MYKIRYAILLAFLVYLASGCQPRQKVEQEPAALEAHLRELKILYTNDEHGYLLPSRDRHNKPRGGVAEIMARWQDLEEYSISDSTFLLLSGGDHWTGQAISTLFEGQSAFEVMNAMGYDASAIGNHEFDFGIAKLRERIETASYHYLASNIAAKRGNDLANMFKPYTIIETNDVKVGIIGLSTTATPATTFPTNVSDLSFLPYAEALQRWVPEVKQNGAEVIIVLGHICEDELIDLAPVASRLGVDLLTGGHCNELKNERVEGVQIIVGGSYWQSYASVNLVYDVVKDSLIQVAAEIVEDIYAGWEQPRADSTIAAIVQKWHEKTEETMSEVIGYTAAGVSRPWPLYNLITDSWLERFPDADVAYTNTGGVRQNLPPGEITVGDVFDVMPFDNELVGIKVTGRQIMENFEAHGGIFAGMVIREGKPVRPDGTPLYPDSTYKVLVNDFMYAGGDNYKFGQQDPNGYMTGVQYRQPVIDYIKSLQTSPENPLDQHLDMRDRINAREEGEASEPSDTR